MEKEKINFWYKQADCLPNFEILRIIFEEGKQIMSIDLVIVGYHVKGAFRASVKIDSKFTSGRNTTKIFRLAHVQCNKDNGYILGNTFMAQIGDRLKNIYAGRFLG